MEGAEDTLLSRCWQHRSLSRDYSPLMARLVWQDRSGDAAPGGESHRRFWHAFGTLGAFRSGRKLPAC